jgi:hypothetical protein
MPNEMDNHSYLNRFIEKIDHYNSFEEKAINEYVIWNRNTTL